MENVVARRNHTQTGATDEGVAVPTAKPTAAHEPPKVTRTVVADFTK